LERHWCAHIIFLVVVKNKVDGSSVLLR
jgi:hypothetical protein